MSAPARKPTLIEQGNIRLDGSDTTSRLQVTVLVDRERITAEWEAPEFRFFRDVKDKQGHVLGKRLMIVVHDRDVFAARRDGSRVKLRSLAAAPDDHLIAASLVVSELRTILRHKAAFEQALSIERRDVNLMDVVQEAFQRLEAGTDMYVIGEHGEHAGDIPLRLDPLPAEVAFQDKLAPMTIPAAALQHNAPLGYLRAAFPAPNVVEVRYSTDMHETLPGWYDASRRGSDHPRPMQVPARGHLALRAEVTLQGVQWGPITERAQRLFACDQPLDNEAITQRIEDALRWDGVATATLQSCVHDGLTSRAQGWLVVTHDGHHLLPLTVEVDARGHATARVDRGELSYLVAECSDRQRGKIWRHDDAYRTALGK